MSAFCIYGMTMHLARELAEDRVGRYVDLGAGRRREMTQEERVAAVGHRARDIYEKWRPRQISPAFDTPQFALDWLAVAHRSTKMRGGGQPDGPGRKTRCPGQRSRQQTHRAARHHLGAVSAAGSRAGRVVPP